ncbi:GAF domain-like protein [Mycena rebaudengoi]|nr:GAF domain-like protein [Mycena rebaudengoi]
MRLRHVQDEHGHHVVVGRDGSIEHAKGIRTVAKYLRLKQFAAIQVSQELKADYQDLSLPSSLEAVAGMLHVPLSREGSGFICFMRRGELTSVRWAGRPTKNVHTGEISLQPRKPFDIWSEMVQGKCRAWTVEQQEAAVVLALVYGTFIEVWRQKERALQMTRLSRMLLANASHEVRTPLNHITNYLEMALDGPLDEQTRDNLTKSVSAANSLLFAINDLLPPSITLHGTSPAQNVPSPAHTPRPPRSSASSPAKKKKTQANNTATSTATTSRPSPTLPRPLTRLRPPAAARPTASKPTASASSAAPPEAYALSTLHSRLKTLEDAQRATTHLDTLRTADAAVRTELQGVKSALFTAKTALSTAQDEAAEREAQELKGDLKATEGRVARIRGEVQGRARWRNEIDEILDNRIRIIHAGP